MTEIIKHKKEAPIMGLAGLGGGPTGLALAGGIIPGDQVLFEVIAGGYNNNAVQTWTCPDGVTSVSVVCIGAGSRGGWAAGGQGGSGGGLGYKNNISVTPGNTYHIYVGHGDDQSQGSGAYAGKRDSWFSAACSDTLLNCANAAPVRGGGVQSESGGSGGTYTGDGGGNGGTGGTNSSSPGTFTFGGGGGGAGGYAGNGGNGGNSSWSSSSAGSAAAANSGGGGGGGGDQGTANKESQVSSGGGGGVGVLGIGATGSGGSSAPSGNSSGGAGAGGPGSGGVAGSTAYDGGKYGGGSGAASGVYPGNGAVRIIWPGDLRQFPSTRTADE